MGFVPASQLHPTGLEEACPSFLKKQIRTGCFKTFGGVITQSLVFHTFPVHAHHELGCSLSPSAQALVLVLLAHLSVRFQFREPG